GWHEGNVRMKELLLGMLILTQGTLDGPPQDLEGRAKQAVAGQRFAEARALYGQLSAQYPENFDYLIWIGRISGWIEDYDAASEAFDRVLERQPRNTDALIAKANILMYERRYRSAEELLNRAEAIVPESVDLRLALARNMLYQGRLREARE